MESIATDPAPVAGPPTRPARRVLPGLELNAFALMITTGITSGFGLVFWAVAAQYPAAEVGRSSAVISTASMLAVLASLSVGLTFTRFLGSAGDRSRAMVLYGYAAAAVGAALLSTTFVVVFAGDELLTSPLEWFTFPLLTVTLTLFVLQDWVLIALRAARWVPIEQFVFATGKLGLLALFVMTAMHGGIVLAWALPAALAVLVISPFLVLRVLPRRPAPPGGAVHPSRRELKKIFVGEYATGATTVLVPLMLPLIVVSNLGTQANAYYALPWLISEALNLLLWNIYSSFMAEASNDRDNQPALIRRTFRLAVLVGLGGVPFLLVGAPWLLTLLGGAYAAEGSTLLRLLAVALPFTIVYSMYISVSRVRGLIGRVVTLQVISGVITVGGTVLLVQSVGIAAVGISFLTARAVTTLFVAAPLLRILRERPAPAPAVDLDAMPGTPVSR